MLVLSRGLARPRQRAAGVGAGCLLLATVVLPDGAWGAVDQVHLMFNGDTATRMKVVWHTGSATNPNRVQYGTTPAYGSDAYGTGRPSSGTGWLHEATLQGLQPDTVYSYRVSDDVPPGGWSAGFQFRTAPPAGQAASFQFTAVGDIGTSQDTADVANAVVSQPAAFHLVLGDNTNADAALPPQVQPVIDTWFNMMQPIASARAMMPLFAGHDYNPPDSIANYLVRFGIPSGLGGEFYSFDYGRVRVFMCDTSVAWGVGSAQYQWLQQTLNATPASIDWRIVCFHVPPYTSGWHGSTLAIRQVLQPLFDTKKVDLVLTAHDMDYERTYPVRYDEIVTSPDEYWHVNPTGSVYVVAGGGGIGLRPMSRAAPPWSAYREANTHHFARVAVTADRKLKIACVRTDGAILDECVLEKTSPLPGNQAPQVSASAAPATENAPMNVALSATVWDPEGDPVSTQWDFGDGSAPVSDLVTSHVYDRPGTYRAVFSVQDSAGNRTVRTFRITVTRPRSHVGVMRKARWFLDTGRNDFWDGLDRDTSLTFGTITDAPVLGDWNGDGVAKIGTYRAGRFTLDFNGNGQWDGAAVDWTFAFGFPTDLPVVGDWNGDGRADVGVFRSGQWYLDWNGNGAWDGPGADWAFVFGQAGDLPVAGDWNGDGYCDIGVFRGGEWYLDMNWNGWWDGPGIDRLSYFGFGGCTPVTGDWNGDNYADVGVFWYGWWYLDWNGNGAWDGSPVDREFPFGLSDSLPVSEHRP